MDSAEKRDHVMLTKAEEIDVSNEHHLVVVDLEKRVIQDLHRVLVVALGEAAHGRRHPGRRAFKTLATGVLTYLL